MIVNVPIRSLEEYSFRYDPFKKDCNGQGAGDSNAGDVIGTLPGQDPGKGRQAGNEPGIDYYEAEFTIDELAEMVFAVFFSRRRRHTRCSRDWSSDVCSSDLEAVRKSRHAAARAARTHRRVYVWGCARRCVPGLPYGFVRHAACVDDRHVAAVVDLGMSVV